MNYWAPEDVERALCLMGYESGGDPDAWSDTDDHGLLQINYPTWGSTFGVTRADLYDPELNVRLAHTIYRRQGWTAWSPYNRGLCH